jgi:transcriptional regulator GlxA family with amidase domain
MKRRDFLTSMAIASVAVIGTTGAETSCAQNQNGKPSSLNDLKLMPPKEGQIPVAFLIGDRATIIDFCGPWEVFQDVNVPGRGSAPFSLFTVAETAEPITATAGMRIIPNFTYANAPAPKVIVIPAQGNHSQATIEWLRKASETAEVVMSVCTGAFLLAKTGMIDGKNATTHHDFFDQFAKNFPKVELKRGLRFVEEKKFSSAGGLTSGIDMALRVVERYFGREVASQTAFYMEYQSKDWMV